MAQGEAKRKLTAILSADVVGYSRLMQDDEAATVATLQEYRTAIGRVIERHGGRVVNAPGDNVLAEFPSAVEAVQGACEIQQVLKGRNLELRPERRMEFRIGVNLGDVIEEADGTIYGDGVNIAARMEALAEAGGICISNTVYESVESKLDFGFDFLGEQPVKNIAKPVRVYRVRAEAVAAPAMRRPDTRSRRIGLIAAAAAVVIVIGGVAVWQLGERAAPESESQMASAVAAVLEAPVGPSIAVLPFTNMSGDPEQDYFSDGLTEDIITELARFPRLRVLARNTTFQYKGQAVDVQKLGRELGVEYVLEGSVRRAGDQVRINAQLSTVADGSHVWAERYDRAFSDIFTLQDEITGRIVATLASDYGVIVRDIQQRAAEKSPDELQAYEMIQRANGLGNEWRRDAYFDSKQLLKDAIALDHDNVEAHIELAWWTLIGWIIRYESSTEPPPEVKDAAIKAAQLDPTDPRARMVAAFGYFFDKQMGRFEQEAREAFELAPLNADLVAGLGMLIGFTGQWERGVKLVKRANELDKVSAAGWYHTTLFYDHYLKDEYEQALEIIQQHPLQDLSETILKLIPVYGQLGDNKKALEYWTRFLRQEEGDWPEERVREFWRLWNFREEDIDKLIEGFHKAGVLAPQAVPTH